MKKFWFITFIIILAFAGTSCSKYEEGPLISLKSKKNRLLGMWKVVELKKDNENITKFYQDTCGCDVEFLYDAVNVKSDFIIHCPINSWNYIEPDINVLFFDYSMCIWSFSSNYEYLLLNVGMNNDSRYRWGMYPLTICNDCWAEFKILRLTNKELWFRYDDIQNVYTIKFEKI